ncbi:MAG: ATP-binding cassette domain-containing protein [Candidatus Bathyarchaeia archaeon]
METTLLEIENLKKYFPILGGVLKRKVAEVKAVDGVSFKIFKGETFGVVGESGCGKTTLGKTILRLYKPNDGKIIFNAPNYEFLEIERLEEEAKTSDPKRAKAVSEKFKNAIKSYGMKYLSKDEVTKVRNMKEQELISYLRDKIPRHRQYDLTKASSSSLRKLRRFMQIVYQDPTTSLDPRMLVKDIVAEPIVAQGIATGRKVYDMVVEALENVGLTEKHLYRYPHEFSGGQRQRIAVARAIITRPAFIVLDEPTSSVDVSVRAQLLDLFQDLQKRLGITYMFVSHDLSVVECISRRVAVMYLGKIVELAKTETLYKEPLHPYAQALFAAIPIPDPTKRRERPPITGEVPSPVNPPPGCRFHPRCPKAMDVCKSSEPKLVDVGDGHFVACYAVSK